MITRRPLLLGAAAFGAAFAAGCNKSSTSGAASSADEMSLGPATAPAHLIEYASSSCPICALFHKSVWAELKRNYIDTGKLRFTFREYPAHEPALAVAGFQVARCGGATTEQYFTRLDALFDQQEAILGAGSMEGARQKLVQIGAASGLSEQQVMACISDESGAVRVARVAAEGDRLYHIPGTPTLILNDHVIDDPAAMTYAGLSRMIDAAIAGH